MPLEAIELPPPRVEPPASLSHLFRSDPYERVSHALGRGYRDVVRGFRGRIADPPDLVAYPGDEGEIEAVLAWCAEERLAAIPYGGGTSVVGGVEPRIGDAYPRGGDDRPAPASTGCSRWMRCRGRRGSRPAPPGPRSRTSSASRG